MLKMELIICFMVQVTLIIMAFQPVPEDIGVCTSSDITNNSSWVNQGACILHILNPG
jgi:hypothetical protein